MNNLNKMLKQLKYKKLRNEKDKLKQTIKEKKKYMSIYRKSN